jgi:hypothetical protein
VLLLLGCKLDSVYRLVDKRPHLSTLKAELGSGRGKDLLRWANQVSKTKSVSILCEGKNVVQTQQYKQRRHTHIYGVR